MRTREWGEKGEGEIRIPRAENRRGNAGVVEIPFWRGSRADKAVRAPGRKCGRPGQAGGPSRAKVGTQIFRQRLGFGLLLLGAVVVRLSLFDFVSGDMRGDMIPWSEIIEREGAWRAWGQDFSNYPPLYLYLLTLATWLPLPRLYAIKLVYVAFDFVLAAFVGGMVRRRTGTARGWWRGFLATLWLPTVVMNASLWGQCDAMYTAGMAGGVYYLLKRRNLAAMVALGVAFSLKPQAVFLGPFILVLILQRRLSPLLLYVIPAVYLILALPAWLAGRPLGDLILLYAHQRILPFPSLTLGATNLYQWLSDAHFKVLFPVGLGLAAVGASALVWWVPRRHRAGLDEAGLLRVALLSVVLMPYLLPAMHERYFFPADVLAVAYGFWTMRGWVVAGLIQTASFFTYLPYLFDWEPIPRPVLAGVMGLALAGLLYETWAEATTESAKNTKEGKSCF